MTSIGEFQDSMRAIYGVGQNAGQRQRRLKRLAAKQGGICPECQLPLPEDLTETEIDHIIPRAHGGPSATWNKRLLHLKCNRQKSAKLSEEARELAAQYGIELHDPLPRAWPGSTRLGGGGGRGVSTGRRVGSRPVTERATMDATFNRRLS